MPNGSLHPKGEDRQWFIQLGLQCHQHVDVDEVCPEDNEASLRNSATKSTNGGEYSPEIFKQPNNNQADRDISGRWAPHLGL